MKKESTENKVNSMNQEEGDALESITNEENVSGEGNVTELIQELEQLHDEVHKQNSRGSIFFNGIISGLGRTIGATIVFAILITILSYIIRTSDAQWVRELLGWLGLTQYLNI